MRSRRHPGTIARLVVLATAFGTVACRSDRVMTFERDTVEDPWGSSANEATDGAIRVVPLETPDGTGQIMHPDYAGMPGWRPRHFLMATPYAFARDAVENPALYT